MELEHHAGLFMGDTRFDHWQPTSARSRDTCWCLVLQNCLALSPVVGCWLLRCWRLLPLSRRLNISPTVPTAAGGYVSSTSHRAFQVGSLPKLPARLPCLVSYIATCSNHVCSKLLCVVEDRHWTQQKHTILIFSYCCSRIHHSHGCRSSSSPYKRGRRLFSDSSY